MNMTNEYFYEYGLPPHMTLYSELATIASRIIARHKQAAVVPISEPAPAFEFPPQRIGATFDTLPGCTAVELFQLCTPRTPPDIMEQSPYLNSPFIEVALRAYKADGTAYIHPDDMALHPDASNLYAVYAGREVPPAIVVHEEEIKRVGMTPGHNLGECVARMAKRDLTDADAVEVLRLVSLAEGRARHIR